tara:strand:+ start:1926 stop:2096 length:171 start_codon:yes stop_codon:yes gene_type:complete
MNKKSVNKYISHVGEVIKLIDDLGWDYDRMSSSGQETYDILCKRIGLRIMEGEDNA